jgi:hypothetical protein
MRIAPRVWGMTDTDMAQWSIAVPEAPYLYQYTALHAAASQLFSEFHTSILRQPRFASLQVLFKTKMAVIILSQQKCKFGIRCSKPETAATDISRGCKRYRVSSTPWSVLRRIG